MCGIPCLVRVMVARWTPSAERSRVPPAGAGPGAGAGAAAASGGAVNASKVVSAGMRLSAVSAAAVRYERRIETPVLSGQSSSTTHETGTRYGFVLLGDLAQDSDHGHDTDRDTGDLEHVAGANLPLDVDEA